MTVVRGTEHPVFFATPVGVIGAVVAAPDDPPIAAAVVFGGLGATRAGNNAMWARLTRALAEIGIVSIRADYAGVGESQCAPLKARAEGVDHTVRWFRERTPGLPLLVIGHCYGLVPACSVALKEPDLAGIAAISPVFGAIELQRARESMTLRRRVHVALYHAKKAVGRAAVQARYGRAPRTARFDLDLIRSDDLTEVVGSIAASGRAWFLTGEGDFSTESVRALEPEITAAGSVLDVVPFTIYPTPTPEAQDEVVARTVAWARECIRPLGATA